ncbi:hypothetical protein [Mycobacteroides abscessus]|uniref:hypothetical protein n=1 Tax=Mycobacteroides abscessus TaxID=36809 RepID=UPI00189692ED
MSNDTKTVPDPWLEKSHKLVKRSKRALKRLNSAEHPDEVCMECGMDSKNSDFLCVARELVPELAAKVEELSGFLGVYRRSLDGDKPSMILLHFIDRNAWKITGVHTTGIANGVSA